MDYPAGKRQAMAKKGAALPDGSFPIATVADLRNAIKALGRAKNPAKARAHIVARAKALKAEHMLPGAWHLSEQWVRSVERQLAHVVCYRSGMQEADFTEGLHPRGRGGQWIRSLRHDDLRMIANNPTRHSVHDVSLAKQELNRRRSEPTSGVIHRPIAGHRGAPTTPEGHKRFQRTMQEHEREMGRMSDRELAAHHDSFTSQLYYAAKGMPQEHTLLSKRKAAAAELRMREKAAAARQGRQPRGSEPLSREEMAAQRLAGDAQGSALSARARDAAELRRRDKAEQDAPPFQPFGFDRTRGVVASPHQGVPPAATETPSQRFERMDREDRAAHAAKQRKRGK